MYNSHTGFCDTHFTKVESTSFLTATFFKDSFNPFRATFSMYVIQQYHDPDSAVSLRPLRSLQGCTVTISPVTGLPMEQWEANTIL